MKIHRHEGIYAVVGAPDSRYVVAVPVDKYRARILRSEAKASGSSFFCSLIVGGCGSKLKLAAGDIRVPYFSHSREAPCALTDASARDGYTHLAIQNALKIWVERKTTLQCELEVATSDRKGRNDLVVRNVTNTRRLGLEIQLSPLTHAEMQRRSAVYLKAVDHVQWLYGNQENQACWGEVETSGYTLCVRIDMQSLACDLGYFGFHGANKIGSYQTTWRPLEDWIINPDGLFSPGIQAVLEYSRMKAERFKTTRPAPKPPNPAPPVLPVYQTLHTNLSKRFKLYLFPENTAVRQQIVDAIYRQTVEGHLEEYSAAELFEWLAGKTWSSWWRSLGAQGTDAEIVAEVMNVYSRTEGAGRGSS